MTFLEQIDGWLFKILCFLSWNMGPCSRNEVRYCGAQNLHEAYLLSVLLHSRHNRCFRSSEERWKTPAAVSVVPKVYPLGYSAV